MAIWASLADFQAACWPVAMRLYGYVGFACGRFAVVLVDLWRCHFPFPGVINATVRAAWPWVMGHTSSGPAAEWHWFPKSELGQAVRPWQSQWLSQWLRIWDYWWGENMYTHNYTYIHVYTLLLYIHTCIYTNRQLSIFFVAMIESTMIIFSVMDQVGSAYWSNSETVVQRDLFACYESVGVMPARLNSAISVPRKLSRTKHTHIASISYCFRACPNGVYIHVFPGFWLFSTLSSFGAGIFLSTLQQRPKDSVFKCFAETTKSSAVALVVNISFHSYNLGSFKVLLNV